MKNTSSSTATKRAYISDPSGQSYEVRTTLDQYVTKSGRQYVKASIHQLQELDRLKSYLNNLGYKTREYGRGARPARTQGDWGVDIGRTNSEYMVMTLA